MGQDTPLPFSPLTLAELALAGWILLGGTGALFSRLLKPSFPWFFPGFFGVLLLPGILASMAGIDLLLHPVRLSRELPFGWPGLPFRLALDPLSGFFLAVLGLVSIPVLLSSIGFFQGDSVRKTRWVLFWLPLFLGTMSGVLLADDVLTFLVFWEGMALSSFFLVVTDIADEGVRKAGFLYLLMAQIGTGLILLSFSFWRKGPPRTAVFRPWPSKTSPVFRSPPASPGGSSSCPLPASAQKPASFPCTSGCRRPIPPLRPRCPP